MNKKLANLFLAISAILDEELSHTIVVGPFGLPDGLKEAIKEASKSQEPAQAAAQDATQEAPEQEWEVLDHDNDDDAIETDWEWRLKEGYQHNSVNGVRPERAWREVEDRHIGKAPDDFSKAEFRRPL